MYFLGCDIGSSSIKVALLNGETGQLVASAAYPKSEMKITAMQPGWAEQEPEMWWENLKKAMEEVLSTSKIDIHNIEAIGISYQMHGLVIVDKDHKVIRPSIIWCDSRAVGIGQEAFTEIGEKKCLEHFLNAPGNFTASKLKWVKQIERDLYDRTYKFMLPGDFIAMKMTGKIQTTISGLSEGILWDYKDNGLASILLKQYGIKEELIPDLVDTFSVHGELTEDAAKELGLKAGIKISYRAGDQPNNAFSLNVLEAGEVAATAGTSGVVYGVSTKPSYDKKSRVNTFVHVNHTKKSPRYGVLLCVNGTGIQNSWLKNALLNGSSDYQSMNDTASLVTPGSDGVKVFPFGNGAERILENKDLGASIKGLNFNRHNNNHILRAAQEGIAFGLNYGMDIMRKMGLNTDVIKAGEANMFLSPVFREVFCNVTGSLVELYNTDGAQGAARGAAIGSGYYKSPKEAFAGLKKTKTIEPDPNLKNKYADIYNVWLKELLMMLKT